MDNITVDKYKNDKYIWTGSFGCTPFNNVVKLYTSHLKDGINKIIIREWNKGKVIKESIIT